MREILKFLAWQWRKWEFWQKCFIVSAPLMGASIAAPEAWRIYLAAIPMLVAFGFTFKWFVWDGVRSSWRKYCEERNKLFGVIKDSDC